jgi:hypothetical protein
MNKPTTARPDPLETIASVILQARGQPVILDASLAAIYGVKTKALNQAVKRNPERFPEDFAFVLSREECELLNRSQTVTGSQRHRDPRFPPRVFTEHGAIMAATVLNSPASVTMSLFVVRAFVKLRVEQAASAALLKRLAEIDQTLLAHDVALQDIYQKLLPLLAPPPAPPKPEIGFHVKEAAVPYRTARPRR